METFKERQVDLSNRIYHTINSAKFLARDIIISLTDEQKERLIGCNITEYYTIESLEDGTMFATDGETSFEFTLDDMTLYELKGLIDHILLNILNQ